MIPRVLPPLPHGLYSPLRSLLSPPPDSPIMWWPTVSDSIAPGGTLGALLLSTLIAGMYVVR